MKPVKVYTVDGQEAGELKLPEKIFNDRVHEVVLYDAVRAHMAARRQGNASTKTRGEVSKSKKKLYRQKGTGRSRAGNAASPLRVGGGVAFGPKPRNYRMRLPRKVRDIATRSALSIRAGEGEISVVEDFTMEKPKTKKIASLIKQLGISDRKVLFILGGLEPQVVLSSRNIPNLRVIQVEMVNPYDVLRAGHLLFARSAVDKVGEVFGW